MKLGKLFAKNLKSLRLTKGLSQQVLAERTGLTLRYISKIENHDPNVTLDVLERLRHALDCSIPDLLCDSKFERESAGQLNSRTLDEVIRFLQGLRACQSRE
jgi:transcriptional regulator with XRE-family HTH domain